MRTFEVEVTSVVKVVVNDEDVIDRITGPGGDEWRENMYPHIKTAEDVVDHLSFNYLRNHIKDVRVLEGWADVKQPDGSKPAVEFSAKVDEITVCEITSNPA